MLIARPAAVFLCLAPFGYSWREKVFISWVGLRGAVAIFLASIPLLVGLPFSFLYFDVAFIVVLVSLLVQGWTIGVAARKLDISFPRADPLPQRVELDLPGQMTQELVGYSVAANSPYLRRGLLPSWAKPTLVIRDEKVLTPEEAAATRQGDYIYLLAPPEKAQALDRFFVDMPPPTRPDPRLLGDFFVSGDATLGALAEIYGLQIAPDHAEQSLADYFAEERGGRVKQNDILLLGPVGLLAHRVEDGRVTTVGLRLADPDEDIDVAELPLLARLKRKARRALVALRG
jgi:cell volume regulation protein A